LPSDGGDIDTEIDVDGIAGMMVLSNTIFAYTINFLLLRSLFKMRKLEQWSPVFLMGELLSIIRMG